MAWEARHAIGSGEVRLSSLLGTGTVSETGTALLARLLHRLG